MKKDGMLIDYEPRRYGGFVISFWRDLTRVNSMLHAEIFYKNQKIGGGLYGDYTVGEAFTKIKTRIKSGEFSYYNPHRRTEAERKRIILTPISLNGAWV